MKKTGYILLVLILLFIINGLVHSIFDLWQKQDLLSSAKKELEMQKNKNSKLKADLTYAQTQNFLDETAHNKLFLAKKGETEVILPDDLIKNTKFKKNQNIPNWQQWINLFSLGKLIAY